MSDLDDEVVREIVYDHYSRPRRKGRIPGQSRLLENPSCGDKLSLSCAFVADAEGVERLDLHFEGKGCSISQASASMMAEALSGMTRDEARNAASTVVAVLRGDLPPERLEPLGDIQYLAGVAKLPVRVKCAALAWQGVLGALAE